MGTGGAAHALAAKGRVTLQESVAAPESLTPDQNQWTGQTTRKTLEWDEGNWGVRLDLDQPANRSMGAGDVQAAVSRALKRIHALLKPEQRSRFAYLLRTGALSI